MTSEEEKMEPDFDEETPFASSSPSSTASSKPSRTFNFETEIPLPLPKSSSSSSSFFNLPRTRRISRSIYIVLIRAKINLLLPFGPLAILLHYITTNHGWVFFFALLGIAPLAERLGYATEQLAFYTGPTVGGLLNATFGNATEMIISIYALKSDMIRVVQQSLLGSILSNMLLVLGCAFFTGGIVHSHKLQLFNKAAAVVNSGLLLMAVMGILFPAVLHFTHSEVHLGKSVLSLSRFSSCIMLLAYASYLFFQLRSQPNLYSAVDEEGGDTEENSDEEEELELTQTEAIIWLAILTVWVSVLSGYLVDAIQGLEEGWYDGGSIAFAVFLVIIVTAVSDYRQSLQFQNLNAEKQNIQLEVIRGGRTIKISIFEIVVGDVVPLKIGDQIPADGVLIAGHSLAIDESSMTGESKIVHKDQKAPFLMSGCKVADGVGSMLVAGVGINTEWGLLMATISEDTGEETPLQVRLNGVATFIGVVGLSVASAVLAVLLGRYFTGHTKDLDGEVQFVAGKTSVSDAVDGVIKIFTIAVTIVVVAVPEGLPLAVTLTLAYSMRKMMADKALVRRLSACETMGSATTICSDKTGTLTLNQMTVVEAYVGRDKLNPSSDSSKVHPEVLSLINEGIAHNTTGNIFVPKDGGETEVSGSPTEKAILTWAMKLGMNFELIRSKSTILHVFPFNSEKKRGGVAVKTADSGVNIHWKGAAEIVLGTCTQYLDSNGHQQSIEEEKVFLKKAIDDMAAQSLRCVAIAYRSYELEKIPSNEEDLDQWSLPEHELVLLAIVGIKDPCRPGVKEAVRLCTDAGVKVRMVTGDNLQTAKAIALECGILVSNDEAVEPNIIEGQTFRQLSEKEREQIAKKITVMGRSSPNDKLLLVQALRKGGEVVAVTGDGTNDAPALHEADIGLSMGIQGTEVAKESSDIIILDDNFASVVKVVRWGRSVYANIQKFIQFQLTVNVAALVINVVAACSSGDVPLNAVQLLWVNLIMDTLGALALATEPPTDSLMHRSPVGRREPLITNIMWRNLMVQALYQVTVLLVLNFGGESILSNQDSRTHTLQVKNTIIFNAFVLCQIFNEFNARKPEEMNVFKGVTKNRLFVGIVGMTFVLQIIIIEFLGKFTTTVRLDWKQWLACLCIGLVSWPLAVAGKLIPVPKTPLSRSFMRTVRRLKKSRTA